MVPGGRACRGVVGAALVLLAGGAWADAGAADAVLHGVETEALVTARPATREVELSGFTRPRARVALVTEVAGRVREVTGDVGDRLGEDGVFARLDDTFLTLELEANRVEQQRLRARIEFDLTEAERQRTLAAQGDTSRAALDSAEQALRDDRFALRALEVQERVLEERLRRTRVKAAAGWYISARDVEPGQWVNVGDRLGAAVDLSRLVVPFALTAEQYMRLDQAGGQLHLELPELEITVPAEIYRVNPAFEPETRKIPVELALRLEGGRARGGWRALLVLEVPEGAGTVVVPRGALAGSYEEHWLEREDGRRVTVTVLRGLHDGGETVTVNGPGLAPGQRFRVRPD